MLAAGLGIGIPKTVTSDSTDNTFETGKNHYFVMSVYAAENEKETETVIHEKTVTFPYYKLNKLIFNNDGSMEFDEKGDLSLSVKGKNIESVKLQCKNGELYAWHIDMFEYLCSTNQLYDIIVPYSAEYENKNVNERLDTMYSHIENGDYDEYFTEHSKKPYEEYKGADIVYDSNGKEIGVGLVSNETYAKFNLSTSSENSKKDFVESFILHNILDKEDFDAYVSFSPNWYDILFENPDMAFTDLPHEEITVDVTFKDGSVQQNKYDFGLNSSGELVITNL